MKNPFERFFGHKEAGVPEKKESKEKELRFARFIKKMKRAAQIGLGILTLGSGPIKEAQADQPMDLDEVSQSAEDTDWGVTPTAFVLGEGGAIEFNPIYPFAPVQVERAKTQEVERTVSADLTLPWAFHFEMDPAAHEQMTQVNQNRLQKYVEQEIRDRFTDQLRGLSVIPEDHDMGHEGALQSEAAHVESIRIIGGASPEAYTPDSLLPGNFEWENIETAWARASTQAPIILDQLHKMGVSPETLSQVSEEAREEQFTEQELADLAQLADEQGFVGATDVEAVFNLIQAYNRGELFDQSANAKLDEMVGSKRSVVVEITTKEEKTEHLLLPIPFLPLVLLALGIPRRREKRAETKVVQETSGGPPVPEAGEGGEETIKEEDEEDEETVIEEHEEETIIDGSEEETIKKEDKIPDIEEAGEKEKLPEVVIPGPVAETPLPERGTEEFKEMLQKTVVDDLCRYMGDVRTIDMGLDYELMVETVGETWNDEQTNQERENWLTMEILDGWERVDRKKCEEAGVKKELDYRNDRHQIKWAKMHALVLRQVADEWHKMPEEKRNEDKSILDCMGTMARPIVEKYEDRIDEAEMKKAA